jgi:hypothetical protein
LLIDLKVNSITRRTASLFTSAKSGNDFDYLFSKTQLTTPGRQGIFGQVPVSTIFKAGIPG